MHREHQAAHKSPAVRVAHLALAVVIILVGIVALPAPGPGTLVLAFGFGMIARESMAVAKILDKIELKGRKVLLRRREDEKTGRRDKTERREKARQARQAAP